MDAELTEAEYREIGKLPYVQSVNRMGNQGAFLTELMPVTQSDSVELENMMVNLYSYDNLSQDSPFSEHTYQLTEGELFTTGEIHQAVVNADFAALNGLKVGDTFSLQKGDGSEENKVPIDVTICGLIFVRYGTSAGERNFSSLTGGKSDVSGSNLLWGVVWWKRNLQTLCLHRPAGGTFRTGRTASGNSSGESRGNNLRCFVPADEGAAYPDDRSRTSDADPDLTDRVFVVSLLLCMWMRSRQKEMAVFISLGEAKIQLFFQAFLESAVLFLVAAACSCGLGIAAAKQVQKLLFASLASDMTMTLTMEGKDVIQLLGMGGIVVVIAVLLSILPVLRSNPRDILSRMEG